jgi:putative PIN family toxin of toxin-antitoxin system
MNLSIVVNDTNVLISGFLNKDKGTPPVVITNLINKGILSLYYNETILTEYLEVASRPKFIKHFDLQDVIALIDIIKKLGKEFIPTKSKIPMPHESDRIFYDTAKQSGAVLITGNLKDFPDESFIMSPSDFMKLYESGRLE